MHFELVLKTLELFMMLNSRGAGGGSVCMREAEGYSSDLINIRSWLTKMLG